MKLTDHLRGPSSAVLLLAAGLLALPALAQDPAPAAAEDSDEEVVVTGSRIRGTPENAALPVQTIGKEDLNKRGAPSTLELIKSLPTIGAVLGDSNQYSAFAQGQVGAGSINLRGLGGLRTLTLFNGRRTVISPGAARWASIPISSRWRRSAASKF